MNEFDWKNLIDPLFYINFSIDGVKVGLWLVLFIVFAETGLFAGFFLPGDSLLFLAGIYSRELIENFMFVDSDFLNVVILAALVAAAGILGNTVGYWFGAKSGYYLYNKQDTFWFKKKYLVQSKDFFEKHGGRAIILARFLPIFRTFVPFIAGIANMNPAKHFLYNVIGAILWVLTFVLAGYFFGLTPIVKENFSLVIIGILVVTILPGIFAFLKSKFSSKKEEESTI